MELSTEDKQRIAIEVVARYIGNSRGIPIAKKGFIEGAEYATRFEREQQTKEIERLKDNITWLEGDIDVREIREDQQAKRIEQLEAERSELIEVIQLALNELNAASKLVPITKDTITRLENSLKTK